MSRDTLTLPQAIHVAVAQDGPLSKADLAAMMGYGADPGHAWEAAFTVAYNRGWLCKTGAGLYASGTVGAPDDEPAGPLAWKWGGLNG